MSIFGRSEPEQAFASICRILAANGDTFRPITLNECVEVMELWAAESFDPGGWAQSIDNVRAYYHLVSPYVASEEKAAMVSPLCRKVLFS